MINELDKNTAILIITPHQIQPALSFLVFNNAFQDKVFARVHRLVGRLHQKLLGLLFLFNQDIIKTAGPPVLGN